ncbi:xanthine dehydrogenase family protein subunit M [candidate division KSB1 bacterium]|nr:xanthine dehydrogenase family protein subunit M [candidate division KSB1 bacterium]
MIQDIDFYRPGSLEELLTFLKDHGSNVKIIAGGTDIVPGLRQKASRFSHVKTLADIQHLHELKTIEISDGHLSIGSCATFSQIEANALIRKHFPLLSCAAGLIGSTQIRNRATIAGNVVNNAPCADSVPPLLVYDAIVCVRSHREDYTVPLNELLLKPYQTRLNADEVLTGFRLPVLADGYRGEFYKLGRRRGVSISRISLAVLMQLQGGSIQDFRVASGAITPVSVRLSGIEEYARDRKAGSELFAQLAQQLGNEIIKITGMRWSTPYKLPVVQQMFYQILMKLNDESVTG